MSRATQSWEKSSKLAKRTSYVLWLGDATACHCDGCTYMLKDVIPQVTQTLWRKASWQFCFKVRSPHSQCSRSIMSAWAWVPMSGSIGWYIFWRVFFLLVWLTSAKFCFTALALFFWLSWWIWFTSFRHTRMCPSHIWKTCNKYERPLNFPLFVADLWEAFNLLAAMRSLNCSLLPR